MSVLGNNLFRKLYYARNHLTQTQFIAYGFLGIILTGTVLLMTPGAIGQYLASWSF